MKLTITDICLLLDTERIFVNLKFVKEPLTDPNNTIKQLLEELEFQATEAAKPMDTRGDLVHNFSVKCATQFEANSVRELLKVEIERRFNELRNTWECPKEPKPAQQGAPGRSRENWLP